MDLIDGAFKIDRSAVRAMVPDLSERLSAGDRREEPPEIAPAAQNITPLAGGDEEAAIGRARPLRDRSARPSEGIAGSAAAPSAVQK